ncbi:MAG: hypothetical protein QY312_03055 [Candidatus Dojkabacteria bacterium]|nr:MAG: hypothetical protein QY312_03055 [Candidatus Dojkabacteria bacterium]
MARNENSPNVLRLLGDVFLTVFAVAIVGVTFYGVSALTPQQKATTAENDSPVLGVSTKEQQLQYFPANTSAVPIVQEFSISGDTSLSGNATLTLSLTPLLATRYSFTVTTVKNTSFEYKKIRVTPSYSLTGNFVSITLVYAGQETALVSTDGTIQSLDLVFPPSSASDVSLILQPATTIAAPSTLTLDFAETN